MIKEAFVSFEVAKLLEKKGFEILTSEVYDNQNKLDYQNAVCWQEKRLPYISAPTHQMAMAWLREEKNIIVNVWYNGVDYATEYFEPNTQMGVGKFVFIGDGYYAYEDAVEAALKYCLKNLI